MSKKKKAVEVMNRELTVYDGDKESFVTISQQQQSYAAYLHRQVAMGVFITALAIQRMFDEKLYLAMGCSTKEEYADTMLPFGRHQAFRYYKVAQKFKDFLAFNVAPEQQKENEFSGLGIQKLYELTQIEDKDLGNIVKTGKLITKDGSEYTIEDIKDMTTKEFAKTIREVKSKYSGKLSALLEENKLLKAERGLDKQLIESAEEKITHAQELELIYGAGASKLADKKKEIALARDCFNDAWTHLHKANVTSNDPKTLQREVPEILNMVMELHGMAVDRYLDFIDMREACRVDDAKLKNNK
jgi:hypothetical protein